MDNIMHNSMRTGPHPLSAHIALAGAALQGIGRPDEAQKLMAEMLAGIQKYQRYDLLPQRLKLPVVLEVGTLRLLHVGAHRLVDGRVRKRPILLVPSLINRYNIFDLYEERSFVRWLAAHGHDVYLIDWGDLVKGEGQKSLDAVVRNRLNYCAEFVAHEHKAAVNAIGYCMGGTLLVGAASIETSLYHTSVFIATPWDFSAVGQEIISYIFSWAPCALSYLKTQPILPCSYIQSLFAALYPKQEVEKFSRFLHMEAGSVEEHIFVAVEDWLNDGVDLPHDIAFSCIQDWFIQNNPQCGKWSLGTDFVRPEKVLCPAFVVASMQDKLVAYKSSRALYQALPNAKIYNPECGHIGMMAGRGCIERVWEPIRAWIDIQDRV